MQLPDFIATLHGLGFVGVTLVALTEKLVPIVPSYVLLVFLGMTLVSDPHDLAVTVVATTLGSTLGSACWYGLGRAIGAERIERLVARFGRYGFLSVSLYQRLTRAYLRNQFWVTAAGQLVPTARIYLALPAGVLQVEPRGFVLATLLGAITWNSCLLTLGYMLRNDGRDPAAVGIMVVAGLILMELTLVVGIRMVLRYKRRDQSRNASATQS